MILILKESPLSYVEAVINNETAESFAKKLGGYLTAKNILGFREVFYNGETFKVFNEENELGDLDLCERFETFEQFKERFLG